MQNKRGISQAFGAAEVGRLTRRATVFDVFDISRVLCSSIRELCRADHLDDPTALQDWLHNKTPEHIRDWLGDPGEIWVIEVDGHLAAVGGIGPLAEREGLITLNYVSPEFRFQGLSNTLLTHLEARLVTLGAEFARLEATQTARGFYVARGWKTDSTPCGKGRSQCQSMVKRLSRAPDTA
ncbi:GNAT family N-acetyltransferase [Aliisedimentitalea scapharcae]|uniref:GNAT family N-acetyltransferase n=1 Tax=Aliisedimentitalea scapharcae TaxID=1524259 RepID=A0ABZ2XSE3_9RHOB